MTPLTLPLVACRICLSTNDLIGEYGRYAVCRPCVAEAVRRVEDEERAIAARLARYTHDCPAEGCQVCMEVGA